MIATTGIVKVIIKYSRTAVSEGYPDKRAPSKYMGITFLNYNTMTPFGKAKMDYLITDLKIKPPNFLIHDNPTLPVYLSFVKPSAHRARGELRVRYLSSKTLNIEAPRSKLRGISYC